MIWSIGHSPGRIFGILEGLALLGLLVQVLVVYGGFIPYGKPMVGVSSTLILVAGLHALTLLFKDERPGIEWELLLPLPFLAYACIHWMFISPVGMEAGALVAVFVQAYTLYFMIFNSVHGVRSGKRVLFILQTSVTVALLAAFFQHYLFPDWMIEGDRMRNPAYQGGAAGFLLDPANLGSLLVAFLPLSILIAVKYFRSAPVWVSQSALAVGLVIGFVLCSPHGGLFALALVLLALPFIISGTLKGRITVYWRLLLCIVPGLVFIWFGTDALSERLLMYLSGPSDELAVMSRQVGLSQFLASPVLGQGLGSYAFNWETHVPSESGSSSIYAVSTYWDILAETGIMGLILVIIPIFILLVRSFKVWAGRPYLRINREVMGRIENLPKGHPLRRRLQKEKGRVPTQKAILGGLLLGFAALLVYIGWDYSMKLPFVLFLVACLGGAMAAYARWHDRPVERRGRWVIVAILPLLMSVWAASIGLPRFYASHLIFDGEEQLAHLLEDPDHIFKDPSAGYHAGNTFQMALDLAPESASAWLGLGMAQLSLIDARLERSETTARHALPALEKAVELAPRSWMANYSLGRALLILGDPDGNALDYLQASRTFAPHRAEPAGLLGALLAFRNPESGEGIALLEKSVAMDPDYAVSQRALDRSRIDSGEPTDAGNGDVLSAAHLAEQFRVSPALAGRVTGAGLPVLEEPDAPPSESESNS